MRLYTSTYHPSDTKFDTFFVGDFFEFGFFWSWLSFQQGYKEKGRLGFLVSFEWHPFHCTLSFIVFTLLHPLATTTLCKFAC